MPPVLSKLKNKKLHAQTKEVISNVLNFMQEEASNGHFIIPVEKCQKRTAMATGTSISTVKRVKQEQLNIESGASTSFVTSDQTRNKKSSKTELDEFDQALVRRIIHNFYIDEKRSPTINGLRLKLAEQINFQGKNTSVRKIIKKLGFKWQKTKSNRKILIEQPEIIQKRITYLQMIKKYREQNRPIVYVDETYILSSHVQGKSWSDDSCHGMLKQVSKGERLIIVHAGGEMGFIPHALLMWKASKTTGDYHHNMNKANYQKWLKEILIPNLPANSVIVLDNASYHNVQIDKAPNNGSTKQEMKDWLKKMNISYTEDMLKPTLYELVKQHKPVSKRYLIDDVLKEHNHSCLRLPPYHPDLNPIENIWAIVKGWVASHNTTYKIADIEKLCKDKFSTMSKDNWLPLCEHVKKVEKEYCESDHVMDDQIDEIIVHLGGADSDDSSDSDPDDPDSDCSNM